MKRREFIQFGSVVLSTYLLEHLIPGNLLRADSVATERSFFVLIRTDGAAGLDAMLGLDPWSASGTALGPCWDWTPNRRPDDPSSAAAYLGYDESQVLRDSKTGLILGPAAQPLIPFLESCAIVNGVLVNDVDNGHPAALAYMCTGNGEGKTAALPIEISKGLNISDIFGVLFNGNIEPGSQPVQISDVDSIKQMRKTPSPAPFLKLYPDSKKDSAWQRAVRSLVDGQEATEKFLSLLNQLETQNKGNLLDSHVIAGAFSSHVSQFAQLRVDVSGLDTHTNHTTTHLGLQKQFWSKVTETMSVFKNIPYGPNGKSLYDHTTFMVVSEFSRTPRLNANDGKDHNPQTNSVLLAGRGIKGGSVIGKSRLVCSKGSDSSIHIGGFYNYESQRPATSEEARSGNALPIFPENLIRTILELFGVPEKNMFTDFQKVSSLRALLAKS